MPYWPHNPSYIRPEARLSVASVVASYRERALGREWERRDVDCGDRLGSWF